MRTIVDPHRRVVLLAAACGAALALTPRVAAAQAARTPRVGAGPFYPDEIPLDHDNDLVHAGGGGKPAAGTVTDLSGRVLDERGRALVGVRVEIWQCDAYGRYHHIGRDSGGDPNFQGFGRTETDALGRYRFLTIKPVPYTGRTPHIHFKLAGQGVDGLTTQLFVAGEPGNERDWIWNGLHSDAARAAVTRPFEAVASSEISMQAQFDIVLVADGRLQRDA